MQDTSAKTLVDDQSGLKFARSPLWIGRKLKFLDSIDKCIKSADLNGSVRIVKALPFLPGGFAVLPDGGLLVTDAWRRRIYRCDSASDTPIADLGHIAGACLNGGILDSRGGVYVADIGFDFLDPLVDPSPSGVIVYISTDKKMSVVAEDLFFPNGMVITPDGRSLIVAEAMGHRLTAFAVKTDGTLNNRRVWAQFGDDVDPDGICLDIDGAIWVAGAGARALHVTEGGKVDQQITTKRPVYATGLGGPQGRHLFLCTSDSSDPVITHRTSNATIEMAEVERPGAELPGSKAAAGSQALFSTRPRQGNVVHDNQ